MRYNLSDVSSIVNHYLSEIRDVEIQKDPLRFRANLERIASILGYEVSKKMSFEDHVVETPLGNSNEKRLIDLPVLITILRAGLAMHNGLMDTFDRCESAFVSAYRSHTSDENFTIEVEYLAAPNLDDRVWFISDPMLATGNSMVEVYNALLKFGKPKKVIIAVAIATPQALALVEQSLPSNTDIWTAAIDPELTSESYIVPGLGDAGDLAFGVKV
ncbi:MAG: uracil phosphoribosyltransferase [Crocinitomicaceae bacterium]|nr:uracil phosphoribosyltransferase [Crocinitomicaceae bacterium]MDG1734869.1 uracil phosphoribosyltransferase [Crocinitomicaceae bacterium]MDG2505347.1 uracil phosphoribosyltransferase [Crocinitomicaceae bacterium]